MTLPMRTLLAFGIAAACGGCSAPSTPPAPDEASAGAATPETSEAPASDATTPAPTPAPATEPAQPPAAPAPSAPEPVPTQTPTPTPAQASPGVRPQPTTAKPPTRPIAKPTAPIVRPVPPGNATDPKPDAAGGAHAVTVSMLSRGKGVPDEARAAFKDVRALLEIPTYARGIVRQDTRRIGLEGETRLCVEFTDADAADAALARIRQRIDGIDLIDVSTTPCPPTKDRQP